MKNVWEIKPSYGGDWIDSASWLGYRPYLHPAITRSIYVSKKKKNARKAQRKARKRSR